MTGSEPSILDSVSRLDRQDPYALDLDLSVARVNVLFRIPLSTLLVGDPVGYDAELTPSSTLFAGIALIRPQRMSASPMRIEPGGWIRLPPTDTLYVSNAAQTSKMLRVMCLPRAIDQKFYQRFDAPFAAAASAAAVSVTTTATLISAAQPGRGSAMIKNNDTALVLYIGFTSGVTTATGFPLSPGESIWIDHSTTAIYGIAPSGTIDARKIIEG